MAKYVGAVDLGTTSNRFMIFDKSGRIVGMDQKEHRQIFPRPGWVEHDPVEILENTKAVIAGSLGKSGVRVKDIVAIGVANQRETTVIWDKNTGRPYANAVVWQCTRTEAICRDLIARYGQDGFRDKTGLPIAAYFSGPKIKWILDNVPEAATGAGRGDALFGTIESWIIWHLTGGPDGGAHVTDVTNASRTLLMNLSTLDWDEEILDILNIPGGMLPRIVPSIDPATWGCTRANGVFGAEIPVCGALGDQQAALVGQACFSAGDAKNTYGTGCFLLLNTGEKAVRSNHGLITTVAYQIRDQQAVYCLEGSVAVAGSLIQWLRDNLGMIQTAGEVETLAETVENSGGIYIVPAFSGLFAPYWRADARGIIAGITRFVEKGHFARAALEACAYQTHDIVEAMNRDSGVAVNRLKVDGGMVKNNLLMQFQSDILNVPVVRPEITETTALGAAYAAGLAAGFWSGFEEVSRNGAVERVFEPAMTAAGREKCINGWKKAVDKSLGWHSP